MQAALEAISERKEEIEERSVEPQSPKLRQSAATSEEAFFDEALFNLFSGLAGDGLSG